MYGNPLSTLCGLLTRYDQTGSLKLVCGFSLPKAD